MEDFKTPREESPVSPLVKYHVPEYFLEEYPTLIAFLEAYYEYLEVENRPVDSVINLIANVDIDYTLDEFVDFLKNEFFSSLPDDVKADKRLILKHARDFFLSKGTEKSFRFLFRILYDDENIEFFYPSQYILRASDGQWSQQTLVRGVLNSGELSEIPFKKFTQGTNFEGVVDSLYTTNELSESVHSLFLATESVKGNIETSLISSNGIEIDCKKIISGHTIINAGTGFEPSRFLISPTSSNEVVSSILITYADALTGEVKGIEVNKMGIHEDSADTFYIVLDSDMNVTRSDTLPSYSADELVVEFKTGYQYQQFGYFKNNRGFLSDSMVLQDNYYWQQFSYVIKASETIDQWRTAVKKMVHPAGLILFSDYKIDSEAFINEKITMDTANVRLEIENTDVEIFDDPVVESFNLELISHPERNLFRDNDDLSDYWYRYEYWNFSGGLMPDGKNIDISAFLSNDDYFVSNGIDTYDTLDAGVYQVLAFTSQAQTVIGNAKDIKIELAISERKSFMRLGEDSHIVIETV